MDMFQLKDKVVYPGHGIAVVEEICEKTVGGSTIKFMRLNFIFKDMTILVPCCNVDAIGIRKPTSLDAIAETMRELYNKPEKKVETLDFSPSGWNRRNKEYQLKIQGGRLLDLVKIYRDLMYIAQIKELSFGERMLLQSIEELILQELQEVKQCERELAMQDLRVPFKQLYFHDRVFVGEGIASAT
jgi:CarD family transcriptional regulator